MVFIILMNVNKTKLPATKGFTIVHLRLWNMVHESNLNWNRCITLQYQTNVTWDQAQFSFRFVITFRRARRNKNRAWYKPSTKRLPPTFLIDWHLPNQPTKINSVACFSSMQIFHAWKKCRLADLKNSFYLLIKRHLVSRQQLAERFNPAIHSH